MSASSRPTRARSISSTSPGRPACRGRSSSSATGPVGRSSRPRQRASSQDVRLTGWVDQSATAAWLRHASLLVFPSRGPESLSRVLIEASALGVPIAAMHTGGTADIVVHGRTGLLSATPEALAQDVSRLVADAGLRQRLGEAARRHAEQHFEPRRSSRASRRSTPICSAGRGPHEIRTARRRRRPLGVSAARARRTRAPRLRPRPAPRPRRCGSDADHATRQRRRRDP